LILLTCLWGWRESAPGTIRASVLVRQRSMSSITTRHKSRIFDFAAFGLVSPRGPKCADRSRSGEALRVIRANLEGGERQRGQRQEPSSNDDKLHRAEPSAGARDATVRSLRRRRAARPAWFRWSSRRADRTRSSSSRTRTSPGWDNCGAPDRARNQVLGPLRWFL
jgi:hypothetical protein